MMGIKINIKKVRRVVVLALVSVCLSFAIIAPTNAGSTDRKNAVCNIPEMKKKYQESCYSCKIVKTLTETFMNACAKSYPLTSDAGTKLLIICSVIWLALFGLKNVSSFTSLEPSNNVNDLLIFFFKVLVAFVFINKGIGVIIEYAVEPILIAGADFGMGLLSGTSGYGTPDAEYAFSGQEVISAKTINKLFGLNQAIDSKVAENLVIGNALVCHAQNAGAWIDQSFLGYFTLKIPNIWLLLCGAAIWAAGFMLTLSISYYVLDVSFKLGFAIILLPVVIGLWPFALTKDKLPKVISIVLKSSAIFAFLALTTSYALVLISEAMGGIENFYTNIENDESTLIAAKFEITGSYFLIIIFAYLYSIKMIGATITDYVDKFFSDGTFGSGKGSSPMHNLATHATDIVKQKSVGMAKSATKVGGRAALAGAKGIVGAARGGGEKGGTTLYGNAMKGVGKAAQFLGRKGAAIGAYQQKVSDKVNSFGGRQVKKGLDNRNVARLAAGDAALKIGLSGNTGKKIEGFANRLENLGKRAEKHGLNTNQKYRKAKIATAKWSKDRVRSVQNGTIKRLHQGKDFVQDSKAYKATARGIEKGANWVDTKATQAVDWTKDTTVYKKGDQAVKWTAKTARKGATSLENGYKHAVSSTINTAYNARDGVVNIAQQTKDYAKSTKVYKAGKFVADKAVYVVEATHDGLKTAYNFADNKRIALKSATIQGYYNAVDAAKETAIYKVGENVVERAYGVKEGIRYGYMDARDATGKTVNKVTDGLGNVKQEVKSFAKRSMTNVWEGSKDGLKNVTKSARMAVSEKAYSSLGAKYEEKYGKDDALNTNVNNSDNKKDDDEMEIKNKDSEKNKNDETKIKDELKKLFDLSSVSEAQKAECLRNFKISQADKMRIETDYDAKINENRRKYDEILRSSDPEKVQIANDINKDISRLRQEKDDKVVEINMKLSEFISKIKS